MGEQVKDERRQSLCSLSSARRGVHRFVDSEWVFVEQNESAILSQAAMSWTKDMALGKVVCVSERAGGKNVLGMRHEIKPAHTHCSGSLSDFTRSLPGLLSSTFGRCCVPHMCLHSLSHAYKTRRTASTQGSCWRL